ncbi:MAG: 23S rRNA (adenine(2503)-C(2))-methyltransferase RlmN [Terriglobia bacterium]
MPVASANANLFGLDCGELERIALELGEDAFRGRQLYRGIYHGRNFHAGEITSLSKRFRDALASKFQIGLPEIEEKHPSRDGAVRYRLRFPDGRAAESVYMPEENRVTLCLSSQAGCAVECRFCFTALMGLLRNLTAGEILGQVYVVAGDARIGPGIRLNVVFMGMGEPLLNFAAVMKTVRIMTDQDALGIPLRRITLSTSGIIPGIKELSQEPLRPKLAISLNASSDEQRTSLMPINRKYPLCDLLAACRSYPLRPREALTFEYVLLDGINDSPPDALRVAQLLRGMRAKVNLIPYNAGAGLPYRSSPFSRVLEFQEALAAQSVPAFIRISRGQDVRAACGQLLLEAS